MYSFGTPKCKTRLDHQTLNLAFNLSTCDIAFDSQYAILVFSLTGASGTL